MEFRKSMFYQCPVICMCCVDVLCLCVNVCASRVYVCVCVVSLLYVFYNSHVCMSVAVHTQACVQLEC